MGFLKKRPVAGKGSAAPILQADGEFLVNYPALSEFMFSIRWDDGSVRQTGTMFFFTEDGRWKCMLKDRDGSLVAFLTADRLLELLDMAEVGLQGERLDWRQDRKPTGGRRGG